jgi:hypothetical protein
MVARKQNETAGIALCFTPACAFFKAFEWSPAQESSGSFI